MSFTRDATTVLLVFAAAAGLAALLGAKNMGMAIGVGQVAFVGALAWVLLKR